jgi:hypothetical protein
VLNKARLMVAEWCDRGSRDAYLLLPTSLPDNDGRDVGKTDYMLWLAACCHFSANAFKFAGTGHRGVL